MGWRQWIPRVSNYIQLQLQTKKIKIELSTPAWPPGVESRKVVRRDVTSDSIDILIMVIFSCHHPSPSNIHYSL